MGERSRAVKYAITITFSPPVVKRERYYCYSIIELFHLRGIVVQAALSGCVLLVECFYQFVITP